MKADSDKNVSLSTRIFLLGFVPQLSTISNLESAEGDFRLFATFQKSASDVFPTGAFIEIWIKFLSVQAKTWNKKS